MIVDRGTDRRHVRRRHSCDDPSHGVSFPCWPFSALCPTWPSSARTGPTCCGCLRPSGRRAASSRRSPVPIAAHREAVRAVGLTMAREDLDLVPVVDDDGVLAGVMTERALARRYIRESREASRLDA